MSITFSTDNPLATSADALALGHNRKGQTELVPMTQQLMRTFPAAFAAYTRRCKKDRQKAGDLFYWTQSTPRLLFLTVRDSSVGATRLRHVQKALMTLARDYRYYNLTSVGIIALGDRYEQAEITPMYETWFSKSDLKVIVYTPE